MVSKYISTYFSITNQRLLIWVAKFTVVALLAFLIFDRIIDYKLSPEIFDNFLDQITRTSRLWAFVLCFTLMIVNWVLEVIKWRALSGKFYVQSFRKAASAVLIGITSGIITPSRLGEYGGRVVNLPKGLKSKGVHAHFLASLSQNSINILMGSIGAFIYAKYYLNWSPYLIVSLFTISSTILVLILMLYFNHHGIIKTVIRKLPKMVKTRVKLDSDTQNEYDSDVLNFALGISLVRYIVFTTQYALLLYFFGIQISLLATLSGISLIYLIQSGIPLPPFLSMLARGEIAIIVWSVFDASILSILSATFTLWILNLLLPAIVGAYILIKNQSNSV